MSAVKEAVNQNQTQDISTDDIADVSKEIVIGVVGYAGAGCSTVAEKIEANLFEAGYTVHRVKLSQLISKKFKDEPLTETVEGPHIGLLKLRKAQELQDLGDRIRRNNQEFAVASLAIKEIIRLRGSHTVGSQRIAFILDSIKHSAEVDLLRRVYDRNFRLVSVHCERSIRESRLIGPRNSSKKYRGADENEVKKYMNRDEGDAKNKSGQQVRDAFYLGDFFIDNNTNTPDGLRLSTGIQRFIDLLLNLDLVRPSSEELGMFQAYAASLQSSCLSRQVGAALHSKNGGIIGTGANEVPKFGGGTYSDGDINDARCHKFTFTNGEIIFKGCHNDRRKKVLRKEISSWAAEKLAEIIATEITNQEYTPGTDSLLQESTLSPIRKRRADYIKTFLQNNDAIFESLPGIKDIIEYSRAIHAEMAAVFSAARQGITTVGSTLYCTTFPCHNCARHLVTAGVHKVYYIEPYVKSLASELHSDALITTAIDEVGTSINKLQILPFTGVGPRMYEEHFIKKNELKQKGSGEYKKPSGMIPALTLRLNELADVEAKASSLVP